ncbi:MAG: hypothetical protein Kow0037_28690 [Calditrichia bacterium]
MKKLMFLTLVSLLALSVVAFAGDKNKKACCPDGQKTVLQKVDAKSVKDLTTVVDPVCGMKMTDAMLHSAVEYKGQKIGFCNANCEAEFMKNPAKFVKLDKAAKDKAGCCEGKAVKGDCCKDGAKKANKEVMEEAKKKEAEPKKSVE